MKKNMGSPDRIIRLVIAIVIASLYAGGIITGTLGVVLLIVAIIFTLTSLIGFCPLYTALGIRTSKKHLT